MLAIELRAQNINLSDTLQWVADNADPVLHVPGPWDPDRRKLPTERSGEACSPARGHAAPKAVYILPQRYWPTALLVVLWSFSESTITKASTRLAQEKPLN